MFCVTKAVAYYQYSLCMKNAFRALMLLVWWQERHPACKKIEWHHGVVICLGRGADLPVDAIATPNLSLQ